MKRSGPPIRRTPLKTRSWIKAKRDAPRRKAPERITQARTKAKAGADPSAAERAHWAVVRQMGCLVCGRAATIHHVTGYADRPGRFSRSHQLVVPLCAIHHQKVFDPSNADPVSVEGLGHQGFYLKYGIDLLATASRLWSEK